MKYDYTLIRSRRRTLSIEIKNGALILRAPLRMPFKQIENFVLERSGWIDKKLAEYARTASEADSLGYLGPEEIKKLKAEAMSYIPKRVSYYAPLVGVDYGKISIRCQKTRWGSANSRGDLSFNCLLMLAPPEVIDSVVVHELCHLIEMNHSDRFWREVMRVFPAYPKCRAWLKKNGRVILSRCFRPE